MSTTIGLVSLLQNLSNQNPTQGQEAQGASQKAGAAQANPTLGAAGGDQFTPSSQNGQALATALAAGLFSVAQSPFFSPAADLLLQPSAAPTANQADAGVPVATTPATQPAAAVAPAPTVVVATPAPAPAAAVALQTAAPAAAQAASAAEPTAGTTTLGTAQEQLQALNLALAALGLSDRDIRQLDQIASTINDYSPAAYTARAFQLEALAQRPAAPPPAATTTATNKPGVAANPNGTASKAGAASATGTSKTLVTTQS